MAEGRKWMRKRGIEGPPEGEGKVSPHRKGKADARSRLRAA